MLTRTEGAPFDDQRAELLAHGLASSLPLAVAASQANISPTQAAKLRSDPAFVQRLAEMQSKAATYCTMSLPQIAVELEATAREARSEKQYKSAIEAYKLLREMLKADGDQLAGLGAHLPKDAPARARELTRRLRAVGDPIDTDADEGDE